MSPRLAQRPVTAMTVQARLVARAELLAATPADVEELVERRLAAQPALERVPGAGGEDARAPLPERAPDRQSDAAQLLADLRAALPPRSHATAELLVGALDVHGFLAPADLREVRAAAGRPIGRELAALRALAPAGVGTAGPVEHLLVQLDALSTPAARVAARALEACPEDFAAGRDAAVCAATGASRAELRAARELVRERLEPWPLWDGRPAALAAAPEILVIERSDGPVAVAGERDRHRLRVGALWERLAAESRSVAREVARATRTLDELEQRWATLERVAQAAVDAQPAFVRGDAPRPAPLTQSAVARTTGLHESTVSRAVAHRSALLPDGRVVALRELFGAASDGPKEVLLRLVAEERRPLSDAELVRALARHGHALARRTVAKYRGQLGIAPAALR